MESVVDGHSRWPPSRPLDRIILTRASERTILPDACPILSTVPRQDLERALGLSAADDLLHRGAGQFLRRPQSLLGVVNEPFAAATIYPAVLAAWTYLAFS
uniref:hypothetical protein n=1 Tax=Paractinoplanes polyasparticus TaxID=2856853 RepID=UPI001C865A4B|nr:hypothetical protein [Actinoplanes polyasparticus]